MFGHAYQAITFVIILLCYLVLFTIESLYMLYILFYFEFYVLGDDASLSLGSFLRAKHLCGLVHIRIRGEISKIFSILLTVPRLCFFCGSFLLFMLSCLFLAAL